MRTDQQVFMRRQGVSVHDPGARLDIGDAGPLVMGDQLNALPS